jgi:hypothetical protein
MSKSLKQKNQPQIITFLVINACIPFAVLLGPSTVLRFIGEAGKGDFALLGKLVAAPAILSLLVGIIGWSLPRTWKETLVFWRVGATCLPSSRAFTELAAKDSRINLDRLRNRFGKFPKEASKQTALWYGIYRKHCGEAPVEDANGAYLRYREMTTLLLLLVLATLILAFWRGIPWTKSILSYELFVAEYVLVTQAARNAAGSLVNNVLALESSVESHTAIVGNGLSR